MAKKIEIIVNDEGNLELKSDDEFTLNDLLAVTLGAVHIVIETTYKQTISSYKDLDEKDVRAQLYDNLIVGTSNIANSIYPEHVDLYKHTPEAMLEMLDQKVKELDEKRRDQVS